HAQERDSSRFDQGSHQFAPGNVNISGNEGTKQDRLTFSGNGRLPGAVLLERERLLQRLRGVSLSGNRSNKSSSDVPIGDDFRLVDAGDRKTEVSRDWLASISLVSDSTRQQKCQRPPGLGG
ncbi:probable E3 ubiquitin-protein ligase RHY1A, partial [Olea europaea var. sylvestris]|uniref:probable E3 ubiquitin-protein ligase RHY1A n=1 Tax=Olea europaea var. sylvestris TaxID=158386 RepID=UPI000C1D11CE